MFFLALEVKKLHSMAVELITIHSHKSSIPITYHWFILRSFYRTSYPRVVLNSRSLMLLFLHNRHVSIYWTDWYIIDIIFDISSYNVGEGFASSNLVMSTDFTDELMNVDGVFLIRCVKKQGDGTFHRFWSCSCIRIDENNSTSLVLLFDNNKISHSVCLYCNQQP